jgi:hypothetical protein
MTSVRRFLLHEGIVEPSPTTAHGYCQHAGRDWWSLRAPVVVSALCSLVFIARTAFTVNGNIYFTLFDDAMISMRYAQNLAGGHGLLWNPGQAPVEGYTNLLWTLWMAVLHLLPVPESRISLLVMLSGASLLVANLLVVRTIAARLAPEAPFAASLSIWLTALYYPLIYWTLRGMEVGLVTLMISMSVLVALRLRPDAVTPSGTPGDVHPNAAAASGTPRDVHPNAAAASGTPGGPRDRVRYGELIALAALMALGILTRPDAVLPCVVISGFVFWTARAESRGVVGLVLAGSIVGALALHTSFRMLYYGAPFPNTYYLKVKGAALGARLSRGLLGLLGFDLLHLIVPVALSSSYLIARSREGRGDSGAHLLAAIFVALCAYSVYVGGDVWDSLQYANRYITPAMPGLLVLSAMAISDLVDNQTRPRRVAIQGFACLFLVVSLVSAIAPVTLDLVVTPLDERLRIARAALTLSPIFVLLLLFVPTPSGNRRLAAMLTPVRRRSIVAVVFVVSSLLAINGQAASVWLGHNAAYVEDDAWATRYGLALRAATADDATIAVTWAGAIPYFSHRPAIDLLGKSDRVIATRERQPTIGFYPGHDKWDYGYSIGQLRPDVVAELWHASEADFRAIESLGYIRLAPWVFARADSTRIDRAALKAAACTILERDPFVLGSVQRSVTDLEELQALYCR